MAPCHIENDVIIISVAEHCGVWSLCSIVVRATRSIGVWLPCSDFCSKPFIISAVELATLSHVCTSNNFVMSIYAITHL